jgi:hypothetical protein
MEERRLFHQLMLVYFFLNLIIEYTEGTELVGAIQSLNEIRIRLMSSNKV